MPDGDFGLMAFRRSCYTLADSSLNHDGDHKEPKRLNRDVLLETGLSVLVLALHWIWAHVWSVIAVGFGLVVLYQLSEIRAHILGAWSGLGPLHTQIADLQALIEQHHDDSQMETTELKSAIEDLRSAVDDLKGSIDDLKLESEQ
jgi:hypothetical protein